MNRTAPLALAAGLATPALAHQPPQTFTRGVPVAQIRVNLATGQRAVHPWNTRQRRRHAHHPADYIGTSFFAGFTCVPGNEVPFASTHLELYGRPGPVPPHPGCNPADCAEPLGVLDFADVVAFLTTFGTFGVYADLAEPFGTLDFADVIAFLTAFGAGCP